MEKLFHSQRGAVTIVEATFVFPIMFFIVFFLIMAGEAYFQFSRVEKAVTVAAINGAARCENPMLGSVIENGSVQSDPQGVDVIPYRYILTSQAQRIAAEVESELASQVRKMQPMLFRNMKPENVSVSVNLHMNVLVSSFPVRCSFSVPFPIRMIFSKEKMRMKYEIQTNAPISDPSEFVRNVAMIGDVLERSEAGQSILQFGGKVKGAIDKIGSITN